MRKFMSILVVVGTRPEIIKMAPVINQLALQNFETTICATGQHSDMATQAFNMFNIKPDIELNLMVEGQHLNQLMSKLISKIDEIIEQNKPDLVLVHGDTATTIATSLVAFNRKIKIGHVEAGLRTNDRSLPFPEEMNRRLTTRLVDFHFAPTKYNYTRLISEGLEPNNILITGNTVVDSLLEIDKSNSEKNISNRFKELYPSVNLQKKFILVTCHRRENHGLGVTNLCQALKILAMENDVEILLPLHPNPNVRLRFMAELQEIKNIKLVAPLDYDIFIYLLKKCHFVITDSGGIQEEAPTFQKPVLLLRDSTERPEGVSAGIVKLVGTNVKSIVSEAKLLLTNTSHYQSLSSTKNPFGDGSASKRIVDFIRKYMQ